MTWVFFKVITPIIVIGLLILIHELGHFLLAKWCGVGVVKFSIGFGPALMRWRGKETVYQLSVIPLGGFVRMVGDIPDGITGVQATDEAVRNEAEDLKATEADIPAELLADRSRWFIEKSVGQRAAIVAAGPVFNLVSAIIFVIIAGLIYGEMRVVEAARIGAVMQDGPAAIAGVQAGDEIIQVGDTSVSTWSAFAEQISKGPAVPTKLLIARNNQQLELNVVPKLGSTDSLSGGKVSRYMVGVEPTTEVIPVSIKDAVGHGFFWTYHMSKQTLIGIGSMIFGEISPKELAGPIFIFDTTSKQAEKGLEYLLYLMAMLSVSLAILNLLPIPVLDGGHLFFFLIEALFGPISIRKKEMAQQMGFVLLMLLMGYAITNDLRRETPAERQANITWEQGSDSTHGKPTEDGSVPNNPSTDEVAHEGSQSDVTVD